MPHEQSPEQRSRATEIAQLNDAFRRSTQEVMVTQGVQALPNVLGLVRAVRVFDSFTPDNDPSFVKSGLKPAIEECFLEATNK